VEYEDLTPYCLKRFAFSATIHFFNYEKNILCFISRLFSVFYLIFLPLGSLLKRLSSSKLQG